MTRLVFLTISLLLAWPASAQLYRWVDDQGQVHYSDQPPPANIKKTQRIKTPSASAEPGRVKANVVLYSAACGATCDQAAEFLAKRGVAFTLKNADKDAAAAEELKKRTGDLGVPVLMVGDSMQRGYSPSVWDKMLEMGGYPATPSKPAPAKEAGPEGETTTEPPKY